MNFPAEFYSYEAQSRVDYTRTFTGNLDVNRVISGEPCWVMPTMPREKKPKKLILADWTAQAWSYSKITAVHEALNKLIENGFSLYIWQGGDVKPLTKTTIGMYLDEGNRQQMTPAEPERILLATTAQHHISRDQLQVIDDHWLRCILNQDYSVPRSLSVSDVYRAGSAEALEIISHATPPLTRIIMDVFADDTSEPTRKTLSAMQRKFPTALVENKFRQIQFSDSSLVLKLYLLHKTTSGHVTIDGNILTFQHIKEAECLDFSRTQITNKMLQWICENNSHLVQLYLESCEQLQGDVGSILQNLINLEEIDLSFTTISAESLRDLFTGALKLKKFGFRGHALDFHLLPQQLFELEEIDIGNTLTNAENLFFLLSKFSKLEKITLHGCRNLTDVIGARPPSLLALKAVDLRYSNISPENLSCLLANAPQLNLLDLTESLNLSAQLALLPRSLLALETLNIADTYNGENEISTDYLGGLLAAAPNLKRLQVKCYGRLSGSLRLAPRSLLNLENVDFFHPDISADNVANLLAAAPNIKKLRMPRGALGLFETLGLSQQNLPVLEYVEVSTALLYSNYLRNLFLAAPKLKHLDFQSDNCRYIDDTPFELQNPIKLETIRFDRFLQFSCHTISTLLKASPCLKRLQLSHINYLSGKIQLTPQSLLELEFIVIEGTNIGAENLITLLEAAPNLKTVYSLPALLSPNDEFSVVQSLLKHKHFDWGSANLPINILQQVLNQAPNHKNKKKLQAQLQLKLTDLKNRQTNASHNNSSAVIKSPEGSDPRPLGNGAPLTDASLVDPEHNPQDMKEKVPSKKDEPFEYKGTNSSKNQGMIIEKLSQYLTVTQQHLNMIPELKDGICVPLSHFFIANSSKEWTNFITLVSAWNGKVTTLTEPLQNHFKRLYDLVAIHQLRPSLNRKNYYLGDNLNAMLRALPIQASCVLSNPWHAIAVRRKNEDSWEVYDPNYVAGVKVVGQDVLLKTLHAAIGDLVVTDSPQKVAPRVLDLNSFLEKGGLFSLCQCENMDTILRDISLDYVFSYQALGGLLLRTTKGIPAWVVGLHHPNPIINRLTQTLLSQFRQHNPNDHQQQLQNSMEAMFPVSKQELMTKLIQSAPSRPPKKEVRASSTPNDALRPTERDALVDMIRTSPNKEYYEQRLATWKQSSSYTGTPDEYCQQAVNSVNREGRDTKKQLIQVDSSNELDNLRYALQAYCDRTSRPVFYVDKPDDLICQAPFVQRFADNTGKLHKKPGGPLYDFLQAHQNSNPPPVLLVNYERFKADDIVRFNALLDEERRADGVLLPKTTKIIGLLNLKKPDCYQGSDFYSRFNERGHCPFSAAELEQATPTCSPIADVPPEQRGSNAIINLYHSPNWENRLLGCWALHQGHLVFEEGLLQPALRSDLPIEIQNGLWEDEHFQRFWQQLRRGTVRHAGRLLSIPRDRLVYRSEGSDWAQLNQQVAIQNGLVMDNRISVLNNGCFNDFFDHYEWDNESNHLIRKPGIIVTRRETRELHVNVTATLTDDAWAMLLDECRRNQCKIIAHIAPGVRLPLTLQQSDAEPLPASLPVWELTNTHPTQVISSTDLELTLDVLSNSGTTWDVIDISECKPDDLLCRLDAKLNEESLCFEFEQRQGALYQAINNHKPLILKGRFSPELTDALAPLLLKRESQGACPNRLILLSQDTTLFAYHPARAEHKVSLEEKIAFLKKNYPEDRYPGIFETLQPFVPSEPIAKICARAAFLKIHPQRESHNAWQGLHELPGGVHLSNQSFDLNTSEHEANAFIEGRRNAVNHVLANDPYVFLTGLSGVGKTTFVEKDLCNTTDVLYSGERQMKAWATTQNSSRNGRNILFIDEANLSAREWSELEGLFHTPQSILIEGVLYPLNSTHKVVFAGNPISYGDERKLALFFERHGRALLFEPLSLAFIYEKSLKPIFENQGIQLAEVESISKQILNAYRFICECSQTEVLISPRELQMIALLTVTNYKNNRTIRIEEHAKRVVYEIGRSLLPEQHHANFDSQFKPQSMEILPLEMPLRPQFTITPSRLAIIHQLQERLQLREFRHQNESLNDEQNYGGIGGIMLEGEPGIGKSQLVIETLRVGGYEEECNLIDTSTKSKPFYLMPACMALTEKKALLSKAFDEGAVVVIDEINSSPMMEDTLNALLMGRNPAKHGNQRPANPGFMIIGTQNPITMAGRRAMSTALQRRMTLVQLPDYSHDEMLSILTKLSVPTPKAACLVEVYEKQRAFARANRLMPEPCFRDLLALAEENRQQKSKVEIQAPAPSLIELKNSIRQVVQAYVTYNQTHCRFSIFHRHGKTGRLRAQNFLHHIELMDDVNALKNEVSAFLGDERNGNTHTHSFRTMLSNKLGAVQSVIPQ